MAGEIDYFDIAVQHGTELAKYYCVSEATSGPVSVGRNTSSTIHASKLRGIQRL